MRDHKGRRSTPFSSQLDKQVVQLWILETHCTSSAVSKFLPLLSPDERARAERFRFDQLYCSFVQLRGTLRLALGQYLRMEPEEIRFRYSDKGKPHLNHDSTVQFNLSHSYEFALLAFADGCEIGVDVERIRPFPELADVAARVFNYGEQLQLSRLPPAERTAGFFRGWVRKEAWMKATGDGLLRPTHSFCTALDRSESYRRVPVDREEDEPEIWNLHDIPVHVQYQAALAYRDAPRLLEIHSWDSANLLAAPVCITKS